MAYVAVDMLEALKETIRMEILNIQSNVEGIRSGAETLKQQIDNVELQIPMTQPEEETWRPFVQATLAEHRSQLEGTIGAVQTLTAETVVQVNGIKNRLQVAEEKLGHTGPTSSGGAGRRGVELTRLKDIDIGVFEGKEEALRRWREEVEEYVDVAHPTLRQALDAAELFEEKVTEASLREKGFDDGEWKVRSELYLLLKRKTTALTEPNRIVKCAPRNNGFEAWRLLTRRFEPEGGMRLMHEIGELMMLMNKRCRSAQETAVVVTEMDRKMLLISELGGQAPEDGTLKSILLKAMDAETRRYAATKLAMKTATFVHLRQDFWHTLRLRYLPVERGPARLPFPWTSVPLHRQETAWSTEEVQWWQQPYPAENSEEWLANGEADETINALKGKGKGKGKSCWTCGKTGHFSRECPDKGKGKGQWEKGKGKGKGYFTCGAEDHYARECSKGKGKGKATGGWKGAAAGKGAGGWWPNPQLRSLCSVTEVRRGAVSCARAPDEEGFTRILTSSSARRTTSTSTTISALVPRGFKVLDVAEEEYAKEMEANQEHRLVTKPVSKLSKRSRKRARQRENHHLRGTQTAAKDNPHTKVAEIPFTRSVFEEVHEDPDDEGPPRTVDSESDIDTHEDFRQASAEESDEEDIFIGTSTATSTNTDMITSTSTDKNVVNNTADRNITKKKKRRFMPFQQCCTDKSCNSGPTYIPTHNVQACGSDDVGPILLNESPPGGARETPRHQLVPGLPGAHRELTRLSVPGSLNTNTSKHDINVLRTVHKEGVKAIAEDEWVEIDVKIDSGATETVMPEDTLRGVIDLEEGPAFRSGTEYEVANGKTIPNLGQQRFVGYTEDGLANEVTAQICAVNQTLMSVSKVVKRGNRVVFDSDGSYIEHKETGARTWMEQDGGMYSVKMWVSRRSTEDVGF